MTERRAAAAARGVAQRAAGRARAAGRDRRAGRLRRRRRRHASTTCSRASGSPTARSTPWPARAASCASGRAAARRCRQDLSSPWDVAWFIDRVVIAMAGVHQLWSLHLGRPGRQHRRGRSPARRTRAARRRRRRGVVRPALRPRRLRRRHAGCGWPTPRPPRCARSTDRRRLRRRHRRRAGPVRLRPPRRARPDQALLQHPLGRDRAARRLGGGRDTYNGAVRRYDPVARRGLHAGHGPARAERRGRRVRRRGHAARGGRVGRAPARPRSRCRRRPSGSTASPAQTQRPRQRSPPASVLLRVVFTPPTGQKLDDRWGDPTRLMVSATPPELLRRGRRQRRGPDAATWCSTRAVGEGVLHVSAQAAACDGDPRPARSPSTRPATCTSRTGASPSCSPRVRRPSSPSTSAASEP